MRGHRVRAFKMRLRFNLRFHGCFRCVEQYCNMSLYGEGNLWAYMGPHFMLLLSIYVLYSNVTYISCIMSCGNKIVKLFQNCTVQVYALLYWDQSNKPNQSWIKWNVSIVSVIHHTYHVYYLIYLALWFTYYAYTIE